MTAGLLLVSGIQFLLAFLAYDIFFGPSRLSDSLLLDVRKRTEI